jgi:hypothetical protein
VGERPDLKRSPRQARQFFPSRQTSTIANKPDADRSDKRKRESIPSANSPDFVPGREKRKKVAFDQNAEESDSDREIAEDIDDHVEDTQPIDAHAHR